MPIEALAAVSLVGNILQFVETGAKVLTKAKQIHDSTDGLSDDLFNLSSVIDELEAHNNRLKDTLFPPGTSAAFTAADASLEKLRAQCCSVNAELRNVLGSLAVDGKKTKWKIFKKALAGEWKSGRLQSIQASLFALRDEMQFQVTFSLKYVSPCSCRREQALTIRTLSGRMSIYWLSSRPKGSKLLTRQCKRSLMLPSKIALKSSTSSVNKRSSYRPHNYRPLRGLWMPSAMTWQTWQDISGSTWTRIKSW